jgi:hypothetical protein
LLVVESLIGAERIQIAVLRFFLWNVQYPCIGGGASFAVVAWR